MKIGTITEHFQDHYESDEIFSRLKQIGYDGVDYTLYKLQPAFSQPRGKNRRRREGRKREKQN